MDDAKDAELPCMSKDEVEDDDPNSDSYFGFESPSRSLSPDLEFVSEFTPFEDLSRKVVENYKSNLPQRSGGDRQRKFFKGKANKATPEDSVDVEKVLKLISDKSARVESVQSNCKSALKTYGNRRKSSFGHSIESFGLPDDPIITSTVSNDISSNCIDLQNEDTDNWVLDDFKVEKFEIKDEPSYKNRMACGVYNPFYREQLCSETNELYSCSNEQSDTATGRVQNSVNLRLTPNNPITKMIKIDYKPSPKKKVFQPVDILNIRPQPMLSDIDEALEKAEVKFLQSIKQHSEITTPKLIFDVKSPVKCQDDDSPKVKSSKSGSSDVTIELFVTKKKHQSLTPVLEILPAQSKSVHDGPVATKQDLKASEEIDNDIIEVIDLVENCNAPKKNQMESKVLQQCSVEPDVTIEIDPDKTTLQSKEMKSTERNKELELEIGIKSLTESATSISNIKLRKPKSPEITIELEPANFSGQLETINLTEEVPKPSIPMKTVEQDTTNLEILQMETDKMAKDLESSLLQLSAKKEETTRMPKLKTQELNKIELELNKPEITVDLVEDHSVKSENMKARSVETYRSRRSRMTKSQPELVASKRGPDMKSSPKVEHGVMREEKLQESKSETMLELPSIVRSATKNKTHSPKPVLDISPESPQIAKSDTVETKRRRSRSIKSSNTKSHVKEHADTPEVELQESKYSELVELSPIIRGTKKVPRNSEPVSDKLPKSPIIVKADVVEIKNRRSRLVKYQPVVAPTRVADTESYVEKERTDTPEVRLRESKSSELVIESCSSKPVLDISPESPKIVKSVALETKSRRSRSVKSKPKPEVAAGTKEHDDMPEVESKSSEHSVESRSTIHNSKLKLRNSEPLLDMPPESSPIIVKTGTEATNRRSRLVKSRTELVAPKQEAHTKSSVKEERADKPEVGLEESKSLKLTAEPSTARNAKKKLRSSEPALDIPPQSPIIINTAENKSRRSRSVKSQREVATPKRGAGKKSPVKKEHTDMPKVELQESKSTEINVESPLAIHDTPREALKQPVLDISPVRPKVKSGGPHLKKQNFDTAKTVDSVLRVQSYKRRCRNVQIDDDVIEVISLIEDSNEEKKIYRGSEIPNQPSVTQKVMDSKIKERLEEMKNLENSSRKVVRRKNRIPKDSTEKLDVDLTTEQIEDMDYVCLDVRLNNAIKKATGTQKEEPVLKPVNKQELLKIEGEHGMRCSVLLEKLNDREMLVSPPLVKKPRGRPRLSELKKKLPINSDHDSSINNESMKTEAKVTDPLINQFDNDGKNEVQEEQTPVKRGRGRPRKNIIPSPKMNQTIELSIKSKDDLSAHDQMEIAGVDNSCSGKEQQSPLKKSSDPSKLSTKENIDNKNDSVVAKPKQSSSSPDKSAKEKRVSGTFSAWKIRLKDVGTESSELAQGSVDFDELPLSVWLDCKNESASDKDDSMKKPKRRSKPKKDRKQDIVQTELLSSSERDVSAELSKKELKPPTLKSDLSDSPPKTEIESQRLDAQKIFKHERTGNIPIVKQEYIETLRLDDKNVSRNRSDHFLQRIKKRRHRKHINPANVKHKMLMFKELMVILKPLNQTELEQFTANKRSYTKAAVVDSPITKELVPNPVHAIQDRNKGTFTKKPSSAGSFEGSTKKRDLPTAETTDFKVGDIVWAKLGSYPFWPCMITKDPIANCYKKLFGKLQTGMKYHVRFFGDNGQRAWVNKHCIMLYHERDDLEKLAQKLQNDMSRVKQNMGLKINVVSSKMSSKWHSGVEEAEFLKVKSLKERLAHGFVSRKLEKSIGNVDEQKKLLTSNKGSINVDSSQDEGIGSKKRKLSAEFVAAKKPRIKSPQKQLDDETVEEATAAPKELVENQTPEKAATMTRSVRATRRDSLTRSIDDLVKKPSAPNSSTAKNKHLVVEGSNASDTDSKLSDISSVPTSLESQAALFKRNHLFRGVSKDKVCQICEKPGNVMTCRGPCSGIYHYDCAVGVSPAHASTAEETEDDDEHGNKEQLSDDAKVEILTVKSNVDNSVVDLVPTPGLNNTMTLAEKIDYRMRQIMKKFDYGASYTCGTTTDSGEDYVLEMASSQSAEMKGGKTMSTPLKNLKKKEKKDMMEIIKHVTADNVSYKCIKKKIPKKSKSAGVVVNPCSSSSSTITTIITEFKCNWCTNGVPPFCHSCNQEISKDGSAFRQRCSLPKCGKYYHPECLKVWPQTQWSIINTTQEKDETYSTFVCPSHLCHTCFSEDPRPGMQRCISKAVKCLRCPATYHSLNHCLPAGTQLLSSNQIVCPRHYVSQSYPCNANWCFICSKGGDLICCERCPTSVHAECMPAGPEDPAAADIYYCEDCQSGRLPLYDEIVWVKMGKFRWWPAVILFPNEVPESVRKSKHETGEFVAKFFGTYNHFWVHRGNVFLFQEGDKGGSCSSRTCLDSNFNKAIEEAATAHQLKRQFKINHLAGKRSHLKPPPYIKIKSNRPLGNVRMVDHNISNTTSCECEPSQPHPCGPDSDCLNRLLLTECNPEVCPAGERCNNQCFEKREYPPLAPYKTESRGWGLKTLAPLRKGQFVIEYVGEILDMGEYRRRVKKMHEQKEENYYFLTIDNLRMLDAGPKGNLARFMNHSCQPNCETQKWTVNSDTRVGLFAKTDIPVDTELTFNYNLECIGKEKKECNCGAAKCSGFIGVKVKEEAKVSVKKKLGRKKIVKMPDVILNPCFACKKIDGDVGACNNKMCTKFYHLECVGLTSWPKGGKWVCSWHNCNFCLKRTIRCCIECTNSYCPPHAEGNVRYDRVLGFICKEHDPLNKKSKVNLHQVAVFNGKKKVREEKFTTPDLAVMPRRRTLPTRDKKKKLDASSILNFDENVVTSTPVKRPRDESTHSENGESKGYSALKKRKTEASITNASFSTTIVTTRKMARELNQTVPESDLQSVKKRLRIKHENTL